MNDPFWVGELSEPNSQAFGAYGAFECACERVGFAG
jgi:hypothetical protein